MTWYKKYLSVYEQPLQKAPQEVIHEIKTKIEKLQSDTPLVSVVIIAYNEVYVNTRWKLLEWIMTLPIIQLKFSK